MPERKGSGQKKRHHPRFHELGARVERRKKRGCQSRWSISSAPVSGANRSKKRKLEDDAKIPKSPFEIGLQRKEVRGVPMLLKSGTVLSEKGKRGITGRVPPREEKLAGLFLPTTSRTYLQKKRGKGPSSKKMKR